MPLRETATKTSPATVGGDTKRISPSASPADASMSSSPKCTNIGSDSASPRTTTTVPPSAGPTVGINARTVSTGWYLYSMSGARSSGVPSDEKTKLTPPSEGWAGEMHNASSASSSPAEASRRPGSSSPATQA